jgi:hypothetical protein
MSAAGQPQGANSRGLHIFGVGTLPFGVGRHLRSQTRLSGLEFALLARASSGGGAAAAAASVGARQ